tara:strand:+ start:1029 stop:1784 length:756 start_codon:yes stop_codon:yes gene_type:complete
MGEGKYGKSGATDLSDWGRPLARFLASYLKKTRISVIQVTNFHLLLSFLGAWLIISDDTVEACLILVIKGIIDAVDGELARMRKQPSHVGRYWDTVADTIGLIVIMVAFGQTLDWSNKLTIIIILTILFQYSLFNHFSVRTRILHSGDTTSRVDEQKCPEAYPWENQKNVNTLHSIYVIFFSWQDKIISKLVGQGSKNLVFELTISSILGYGMQSVFILLLAITQNLQYIPHLIIGINSILMVITIIRSRF